MALVAREGEVEVADVKLHPRDVREHAVGADTEQFDVPSPNADQRVPVEGWLSLEKAKAMLAAAGHDFDSLKAAARTRDFRPVVLNARASFEVDVDTRRIQSSRGSRAGSAPTST